MQRLNANERMIAGAGLMGLGAVMLGCAAVLAIAGAQHMAEAVVCGPATGHCILCPASVAMAVLGLAVGLFGAWTADARRLASMRL